MSQVPEIIQKKYINLKGKLFDLSTPKVMGILNVTPDSFYDGGRYDTVEKAIAQVSKMLEEGADIIDVGGLSTRPGSGEIDTDDELIRVIPVVEKIIQLYPDAILSVDTYRSKVAKEAIQAGASIVNDISGGTMDKMMYETVSSLRVPYILMHIQGTPQTMQNNPHYSHLLKEISLWFSEKIEILKQKGVHDIILDPGFGFGKTIEHNYLLLRHLSVFERAFNLPVLTGLSRKSMIQKITGHQSSELLSGTSALHWEALQQGSSILRVHDVKEAVQVIKLFTYYQSVI